MMREGGDATVKGFGFGTGIIQRIGKYMTEANMVKDRLEICRRHLVTLDS